MIQMTVLQFAMCCLVMLCTLGSHTSRTTHWLSRHTRGPRACSCPSSPRTVQTPRGNSTPPSPSLHGESRIVYTFTSEKKYYDDPKAIVSRDLVFLLFLTCSPFLLLTLLGYGREFPLTHSCRADPPPGSHLQVFRCTYSKVHDVQDDVDDDIPTLLYEENISSGKSTCSSQ
jgi:hypothetical protein